MRERTVIIIGHADCNGLNQKTIPEGLEKLIHMGYRRFVSGGMGEFDRMSAYHIMILKKKYPDITNVLVIPNLSFFIHDPDYFDEILFPEELEGVFFKQAIIKRNRCMLAQASAAFCYVNHSWGGAAKTYAAAKKAGLKIFNLGSAE